MAHSEAPAQDLRTLKRRAQKMLYACHNCDGNAMGEADCLIELEILEEELEKLNAQQRKQRPVATGVVDYFPDALAEIALVSFTGNEQHNPGTPLHWDRAKSTDEADALMRHFIDRGKLDADGMRHSAKMAWRALALLQKELEAEKAMPPPAAAPEKLNYTAQCGCAFCTTQRRREHR